MKPSCSVAFVWLAEPLCQLRRHGAASILESLAPARALYARAATTAQQEGSTTMAELAIMYPQDDLGSDSGVLRDFAQAAEGAGYSRLVLGEHVLGADPDRPGGWDGPFDPFREPTRQRSDGRGGARWPKRMST